MRRPYLQDVTSGLHSTALCAMHWEQTGPGEHAINDYLVHTGPKSGPENGWPLEFLIPASSDDYLDLSYCYLYLKCWVLEADGLHIKTLKADASQGMNSSMGAVNLLLHLLFRQVDLVMNDALMAKSGDTYPYRAYLTKLLSCGDNAKETWLRCLEGWYIHRWRWKVQCSGKRWPDHSLGDDHQQ